LTYLETFGFKITGAGFEGIKHALAKESIQEDPSQKNRVVLIHEGKKKSQSHRRVATSQLGNALEMDTVLGRKERRNLSRGYTNVIRVR